MPFLLTRGVGNLPEGVYLVLSGREQEQHILLAPAVYQGPSLQITPMPKWPIFR